MNKFLPGDEVEAFDLDNTLYKGTVVEQRNNTKYNYVTVIIHVDNKDQLLEFPIEAVSLRK
jgi:hypothetical protein